MTTLRAAAVSALLLAAMAAPASAQGGYLECTACQMVLGLVDSTTGDGKDVSVDAAKQCSLLPLAADRERCERFWAEIGPKFIKALKEKRARGTGLDSICRSMGYCQ